MSRTQTPRRKPAAAQALANQPDGDAVEPDVTSDVEVVDAAPDVERLQHRRGCPQTEGRVEQYSAQKPAGGEVWITRCCDCGAENVTDDQTTIQED